MNTDQSVIQDDCNPSDVPLTPEQQKVVADHYHLVAPVVQQTYNKHGLPDFIREDCFSWAILGLITAVQTHRSTFSPLHVWASRKMQYAILDGLRYMKNHMSRTRLQAKYRREAERLYNQLGREPTVEEVYPKMLKTFPKLSLKNLKFHLSGFGDVVMAGELLKKHKDFDNSIEWLEGVDNRNPETLVISKQRRELLSSLVKELSPRDRLVVKSFMEEKSMFEIAEIVLPENGFGKVCESRICQLLKEIRKKLELMVNNKDIVVYRSETPYRDELSKTDIDGLTSVDQLIVNSFLDDKSLVDIGVSILPDNGFETMTFAQVKERLDSICKMPPYDGKGINRYKELIRTADRSELSPEDQVIVDLWLKGNGAVAISRMLPSYGFELGQTNVTYRLYRFFNNLMDYKEQKVQRRNYGLKGYKLNILKAWHLSPVWNDIKFNLPLDAQRIGDALYDGKRINIGLPGITKVERHKWKKSFKDSEFLFSSSEKDDPELVDKALSINRVFQQQMERVLTDKQQAKVDELLRGERGVGRNHYNSIKILLVSIEREQSDKTNSSTLDRAC